MKGFAAIGLHKPKYPSNVAGSLRAAHCLGAALVAIAGDRSHNKMIQAPANVTKAERHLPVMRGSHLRDMVPYGAIPIAVDIIDEAIPLPRFVHPKSAFYIFGPEDGTLGREILKWCPLKVVIPTAYCLNLAAAVNIVLYDRMAKEYEELNYQEKVFAPLKEMRVAIEKNL